MSPPQKRKVANDAYNAERSRLLMAFAEKLRAERKRQNISQETLALSASLHRNEIGYLERGEHEPYILTLLILASALEIPPAALLDGLHIPRERRPRRNAQPHAAIGPRRITEPQPRRHWL